jgi:pyruvate-formate lyase
MQQALIDLQELARSARECVEGVLTRAETCSDLEARRRMHEIAAAYLKLAEWFEQHARA